MTNVLFVHQGHQWIRGSERSLIDHVAHLDRTQFRPVLWTNNEPLADVLRDAVPAVIVDRFSSLLTHERPRFDAANYWRLLRRCRELIRTHAIDVIHCNAPEPCQWVVPVARRRRVPVVLQLRLEYPLRLRAMCLTHQGSLVVGVSRATLQQMLDDGYPESKTRVVYNCVDSVGLNSHPTVRRADLGVESGTVVLSVGSLIKRKGYDLLLTAFAPHARTATLVIAGEGAERPHLEEQARGLGIGDRVRFLGESDNVPALMRDVADLFVLPARVEAFPRVLLEAGFFAVPCVATDVGGVSELIDATTGLLVEPDNAQAISQALGRLLESPERARVLGAALQARVLRDMVSPAASRRLESVYREAMRQPAGRVTYYPAYARMARNLLSRVPGVD